MSVVYGVVHNVAAFLAHKHLLGIHLVFCEVFNVCGAESAKSAVHGKECEIYAFDFHSLHKLARKVKTACGSRNCAFVFGENGLETLKVLGFHFSFYEFWHGSLT